MSSRRSAISPDFDVVVLGAGPAGSSTAAFLAKGGWKVALVEKSEFPRRKVCGEFVSATSFPLLEQLGLGSVFGLGGPTIRRVGVFVRNTVIKAEMPGPQLPSGWGRALPRSDLDFMLLSCAELNGAKIFQPWKAVDFVEREGRYICTIQSGSRQEQLRSPVLVLAHGSWEIGTLPTQPKYPSLPSDLVAFKVRFENARFEDDLMALISFAGGYGGIIRGHADTVGLSFCIRRDRLQKCRETYGLSNAGENALRHIVGTVRGVAEALENAHMLEPPIGAGPLRTSVRPRYSRGIFRVGNAAGEAHPVIAEGISMAIQSGHLLAGHLLSELPLDQAGKSYAISWAHKFGGRIRAANIYSKLCMSPIAGVILAPLLIKFPSIITFGAAWSGKSSFEKKLIVGRIEK